MAATLVTLTFLTEWSPSWLAPEVTRRLMLIDPSGYRWLNETFLAVDRGVEFYNTQPLRPDAGFVISRVIVALLGLAAVTAAVRSYARRMLVGGVEFRFLRFLRRRKGRAIAPGAGESAEFEIRAGFDPERVLVDPDVLGRKGTPAHTFPREHKITPSRKATRDYERRRPP